MIDRRLFLGGALGAALTAATALPAHAADHGSGSLGSWEAASRRISTSATVKTTVRRDGVLLFGDSISVQDAPALASLLQRSSGLTTAINAWNMRPTAPAVDELEQWARRYGLPRRIVMATGSNDIFAPPVMAEQVERVMSVVGRRRMVFWVDVHVSRTSQSSAVRAADLANSAWVNDQIEEVAARHPLLRVIRWSDRVASPTTQRWYLRDGVHTNPTGQSVRNSMIARTVTRA